MEKQTQTTVERIVETILAGIDNGTFAVGSALPAQRQLAEYFDVSRNVVREAIKVLEGLGVLFSKQGSGIYVRERYTSQVKDKNCRQVYTLRQIIELCRMIWKASVFKVVENASEKELQHLKKMNDNILEHFATSSIHQKFIYESSFGMNICQLSDNLLSNHLLKELLKATTELDYAIIEHPDYLDILKIDSAIIDALISKEAYRAFFWGNERDIRIEKLMTERKDIMNKTYDINIFL